MTYLIHFLNKYGYNQKNLRNILKPVLFDKVQIREHYNLIIKEKRKKPFENKSKQKLTLLQFRTRINRMRVYCNHHCAIHADTLERALNYILIPWNVLSF